MKIDKSYIKKYINIEKLENNLTQKRYEHSLGVAKTAFFLGEIYNVSSKKIIVASMLHDCAKDINNEEFLKYSNKIKLSKLEKENKQLAHAKIGAYIAKKIYNITDNNILAAISFHTTARPNMSTLEKIIYISDFIEEGRGESKLLRKLRKLAPKDLDTTLFFILKSSLKFLEKNKRVIDSNTQKAYDYYSHRKEGIK